MFVKKEKKIKTKLRKITCTEDHSERRTPVKLGGLSVDVHGAARVAIAQFRRRWPPLHAVKPLNVQLLHRVLRGNRVECAETVLKHRELRFDI